MTSHEVNIEKKRIKQNPNHSRKAHEIFMKVQKIM